MRLLYSGGGGGGFKAPDEQGRGEAAEWVGICLAAGGNKKILIDMINQSSYQHSMDIMKTLTLYTTRYQSILENFLAGKAYREEFTMASTKKPREGLSQAVYHLDKPGLDALTGFLEYIAILEHPVYKHSAKLAKMALELEAAEIHELNTKNLAAYLEENDTLHIEGYAAFRMADYRLKLDMMMYCLVKKLRLIQ